MLLYARGLYGFDTEDVPKFANRSSNLFYINEYANVIQEFKNPNEEGKNSVTVLSTILHAIQHFASKMVSIYNTAGYLYLPMGYNTYGTLFTIGDTVMLPFFADKREMNGFENALGRYKENSNLFETVPFEKYFIWKITYYIGAADTTEGGTSGATQRIYVTNSGLLSGNSYEEDNHCCQFKFRC